MLFQLKALNLYIINRINILSVFLMNLLVQFLLYVVCSILKKNIFMNYNLIARNGNENSEKKISLFTETSENFTTLNYILKVPYLNQWINYQTISLLKKYIKIQKELKHILNTTQTVTNRISIFNSTKLITTNFLTGT